MKAIVITKYGGPEVMEYKDFPDPSPCPDEVLVKIAATSVNPFDLMRRSGQVKDFAPVKFPGIVGVDVAGTVLSVGNKVKGFSVGDRVFGMAGETYAERCVVKAGNIAKIPEGLDLVDAAALPLVTTTGYQLITNGTPVGHGQSVLVTGALGSVGRSAVFTAKTLGATVIAGVRKGQTERVAALKVDSVVAIDDKDAISHLQTLDAVADTVNGNIAELLIGKVKSRGTFASVLGTPKNSEAHPSFKIVPIYAAPDAQALLKMAKGVVEGKLSIPIAAKKSLKDAAEAHTMMTKGVHGKLLLVP